ncbi:MAG: hypothetical protein ACI4V1_04020 [Eubacteriales bacterium]
MKSVYGGYERMECAEPSYFAGANTASGFTGLYGEIADERILERVYVIKGGSGTGKSTLMRKIVDAAAKEGFGAECYLCGSDPYSLDCVVLDGRIAILDGTAPHVRDMVYPGAASSLVDVSKYWDSGILEQHREEIIDCCNAKSACWDSAYRYLRAAEAVDSERTAQAARCFDRSKAAAYIDRWIRRLGKPEAGEAGRTTVRYTRAVTMRGTFYLPTLEQTADTVFAVSDAQGCAVCFLQMFSEKLASAGYDMVLSRLPVTGHIDGIYLPGKRTAIVTALPAEAGEYKVINMTRFVADPLPDGVRGPMRLAAKVEESCMEEALACLTRAAERHFALEEIYRQAMDFPALGRSTKKLCTEVVERLKARQE